MSAILTCNAGSGSFKAALFHAGDLLLLHRFNADYHEERPCLHIVSADGKAAESVPLSKENNDATIDTLMSWLEYQHELGELTAVGHRVVHGGDDFTGPVWVNNETMKKMQALTPLAPLHQPHNISPIARISQAKPHLPQVACFDTSFHRTMSWEAETYALPKELRNKGVKRYGFHGLSYEYIASQLPDILPEDKRERVIVAHLGSGCSACALGNGKSIATTMGLTALDGLIMRTRCGTLDPGVPLYLIRAHGYAPQKLEHMFYTDSGLKGIAGGSGDMRDILASEAKEAKQALSLFCHMAAREIGGLMAALGGAQAIIFTGAIGVHAPDVRARIMQHLAWTGVPAFSHPTDEALMIARHTKQLLDTKEAQHGKTRVA